MKVPNSSRLLVSLTVSLSRLQNEGSQHKVREWIQENKSIKATE